MGSNRSSTPFQTVARPWKLFVLGVGGARVIATLVSIWPPVLGINVKFIIVFNTHTHEQQGKIRDHQVQNERGAANSTYYELIISTRKKPRQFTKL